MRAKDRVPSTPGLAQVRCLPCALATALLARGQLSEARVVITVTTYQAFTQLAQCEVLTRIMPRALPQLHEGVTTVTPSHSDRNKLTPKLTQGEVVAELEPW